MRKAIVTAVLALAAMPFAPEARAEGKEEPIFTSVLVDRLEVRASGDSNVTAWDAEAWAGGDLWKVGLESEGEYAHRPDSFETLENRLLVRRMVSDFFDARAGVRADTPAGPDRLYGFVGLQGLAPQWVELTADVFLSEKGDLTARLDAEYDILLTNRLILQPAAELDLAATDDREIGQGQGLTRLELGLRLRYELVGRTVAPYVGVHWDKALGESAGIARSEGEETDAVRLVAGIRLMF